MGMAPLWHVDGNVKLDRSLHVDGNMKSDGCLHITMESCIYLLLQQTTGGQRRMGVILLRPVWVYLRFGHRG